MGKGSKSQTQSSTSQYTPPAYLGDAVEQSIADARALYEQGAPSYYPGQTYANLNADQIASLEGTKALATAGSPLVQNAQNAVNGILTQTSGHNTDLDNYLADIAARTNFQVNNASNGSGRLGSGSNVATAARAIQSAQNPAILQAYQTDQANKLTAAGLAPGLADYDFTNLARLGTVGDAYQAQEQKGISEDMARYDYNANAPENWLNNYLNQLSATPANKYGTQTDTTTTTQKGGSSLGSILGTALSLGSLFTPAGGLGAAFGGLSSGIGSALGGLGVAGAANAAGNLLNSVGAGNSAYSMVSAADKAAGYYN